MRDGGRWPTVAIRFLGALQLAVAEQLLDLGAIQGFPLEQRLGQQLKFVAVLNQDRTGFVV